MKPATVARRAAGATLRRLRLRRRPDPSWIVAGELSAAPSELRYWQETGIAKGDDLYGLYLDAFGIDAGELVGKTVADFGAGPFGGILSALDDVAHGYPIDVLADEYNRWALSRWPIHRFAGAETTVPAGSCDVVFCTNAIDHTPRPELVAGEIVRILRPRGLLLLHVHCRRTDELNKIHPVAWNEAAVRQVFAALHTERLRVDDVDRVNGNEYRTLYAWLRKP